MSRGVNKVIFTGGSGLSQAVIAPSLSFSKNDSNECLILSNSYPDEVKSRFWSKVQISEDPKSCWVWGGSVNKKGYGSFNPGRKFHNTYASKIAHRYAYLFGVGNLRKDLFVCHTCDTPGCCNPNHLWQGTAKQNSEDMVAKGRSPKGEKQGSTLLTELDVLAIRACIKSGRFKQKEMSEKFGISQQTVSRITNDIDWKHI